MRDNSLDEIVKCDIDLSDPVSSDENYGSVCIIVPAPKTAGAAGLSKTTLITKADELLEFGFKTDDVAYIAANIAFSQNPAPSEFYVCVRNSTTVEDVTTYEDIATTLSRAKSESGAYGFHITSFNAATDVRGAVTWAEANESLFGFEYSDISNMPVENTNYNRTFGIFSGLADGYAANAQPEENKYAALALMAECFGYHPGGETWAYKTLAAIVPSYLTTQQKKDLEDANISTYRRYCKKNVTIGGKVLSGEWIDVIRFRDWLKNEIQVNVFNAIQGNTKTPFTDGGIGMVEGAVEAALSSGRDYGGIAPVEFDEDGNEIPSYTVTVPLAASLSEAERKSRKLSGVKWSARLAGAIHIVEITGNLTF